jgi:biotin operon repressor
VTDRKPTQTEALRALLLTGQEVTGLDALDRLGCFRLASRIHDLKSQGMEIEKRMVKTPRGATIAAYRVAQYQHPLG